MMSQSKYYRYRHRGLWMIGAVFVMLLCLSLALPPELFAAAKQKSFPTPELAVNAVVSAAKAHDTKELTAIFGPGSKGLLSSGDAVADKEGREKFVKLFQDMNKLERKGDGKVILHVGSEDWPFPIPIVKKGKEWAFDLKEGKEEIINRRIGKNELSSIEVMKAIFEAQLDYIAKDYNGNGKLEYAQYFASDKGKKNGLYWEAKEGEPQSPLGPFAAKAAEEGYATKGRKHGDKPMPYHGYYYRILTAQGKHAKGGECNYIVRGNMIGGFAVVAFPAQYGVSGIMTFIMNHNGIIYQKNLGKNTMNIAKAMKKYDPDKTWQKVE